MGNFSEQLWGHSHERHHHATSQKLLAFSELADDLLRRMPSSSHQWVLSCPRHDDGDDRTAQLLDHYKGLIPGESDFATHSPASNSAEVVLGHMCTTESFLDPATRDPLSAFRGNT